MRNSTVLTAEKIEKTPAEAPLIAKNRAVKILARSIYRELRSQGYDDKQVVSLATELIAEVTEAMAGSKRV
jgi:hypothetical protein